jgi:hypothetical protein
MPTTFKTARWSANRQVAAGINWVTPYIEANGPSNKPIRHTLQMGVDAADTVVNLILTSHSVEKTMAFNSNVPLVAGCVYQFDLLLEPGETYNIQHVSGTQNPFLKIFESSNDLEV